jgi:hypothetical protein
MRPPEQLPIPFPPLAIPEDHARAAMQRKRVWGVLQLGAWLTLGELAEMTGDPEASISARLRDFRKARYGGHAIDKRRRGGERRGTWEYRLR